MEIPKNVTSVAWRLVTLDKEDDSKVICLVKDCDSPSISRGGKTKAKHNTTNIMNHMNKKHPLELAEARAKHNESKEREAAKKPRPVSTYFKQDRKRQRYDVDVDIDDPSPSPSSSVESWVGASASTTKFKQQTMEASMVKYWDINDIQSKVLNYKIGEIIALDNQPYSIASDIGFTRLMAYCKPKFKLPNRTYYSDTIVPKIYNAANDCIKEMIKKINSISLTTDNWRALNKDQFISLTGHCTFNNFDQQALVLHTKPFDVSHTGVNISDMMTDMISEFDIPRYEIHNIVHDNASNMVCGISENTEYDSLPCFIHYATVYN